MCKDGINTEQLTAGIEQINEAVALCRRWTHRISHQYEDSLPKTSGQLHAAQALLDDVRTLLEEAIEFAEKEASDNDGVTVQLV
jgi:hypothetical protein